MSREIPNIAGAETFDTVEGKMCGAVMRGADALPRSKTPSRTTGTRRNLGDLMPDHRRHADLVRIGKAKSHKPMMHGHEKSSLAIVAVKPANKAE